MHPLPWTRRSFLLATAAAAAAAARAAPAPARKKIALIGTVASLHREGAIIETPEMEVRYTALKESLFWKE